MPCSAQTYEVRLATWYSVRVGPWWPLNERTADYRYYSPKNNC
jgi:hypothetical protein